MTVTLLNDHLRVPKEKPTTKQRQRPVKVSVIMIFFVSRRVYSKSVTYLGRPKRASSDKKKAKKDSSEEESEEEEVEEEDDDEPLASKKKSFPSVSFSQNILDEFLT